jgi:hypothetical protein
MRSFLASPLLLCLAAPLLFALGAAACSAAPPTQFNTGGGTTTSGSGGHGAGGGLITVSSGTGGGCQGVHCSADLHDVLDCDDKVVTHCQDTEACGPGGVCVADPCAAAAAAGSTLGCDFYSIVPAPDVLTHGSCFAALIANTWTTPITVQAEYDGQMLDMAGLARTPMGAGAALTYAPLANGKLDPGQLAILFLAQGPQGFGPFSACPAGITPGVAKDTAIPGTGLGKAFHITTTAPVVAYDIYPYGGPKSYIASATLLVPTPAWGTNYIAADGWPMDPMVGGQPFIQIVAAQDATKVTISPTTAITGGNGIPGTPVNTPISYLLDKGQALQLAQDSELAGSPITSDKPVSVWGGNVCMNVPVGNYACDSAHQEYVPVKTLGHEYVGARYRNRFAATTESPPWTIIGAVDGTTLTYDPAPPAGAPSKLDSRQMVRFDADAAFTVKSQDDQHPFYLAGHMTGYQMFSSSMTGDPETVNVVPPEQWLNRYLFLTDPTYANSHLVFVRRKAKDDTFKDVSLDCAGTLSGWQPVGNDGKYEVARFDLVVSGAPNGACNNGVHSATSMEPFGLTVWGWDVAVSYAYPAGMSTLPINTVEVPAIPK